MYLEKSMGKRNNKKSQKQNIQYECVNISQDRMIEIQAEAYYRALKKIEQEKSDENQSVVEKEKWYNKILLVLNVLIFPWKIYKGFSINKGMYDSVLVFVVSISLEIIGTLMWIFGFVSTIYGVYQMVIVGISSVSFTTFYIGVMSIFMGSIFVLASSEFSKEKDSTKIYAYSACIIALISCVVSIISLF